VSGELKWLVLQQALTEVVSTVQAQETSLLDTDRHRISPQTSSSYISTCFNFTASPASSDLAIPLSKLSATKREHLLLSRYFWHHYLSANFTLHHHQLSVF